MSRNGISCVVVEEKKKPLGIFTERDLVKLSDRYEASKNLPICSFMSSPVVSIAGHLTVFEAYSLLIANRIRHQVVVDKGGRLLGVLSQSDIISFLGLEYFMELRKIQQIMTSDVACIAPGAKLSEALAIMARSDISCVIVEQAGRPAGIITERDVARLVAEGVQSETVSAGSVMSSPVRVIQAGDTVHKAAALMKQEGIRRVVVVNDEGGTAGIITQTDVIKGLEGEYIESLKEIIREKEDIFQQTANDLLNKSAFLDSILRSVTDTAIIATDSEFGVKYLNPVAEQVLACFPFSATGSKIFELKALEGEIAETLQGALEHACKRGKASFVGQISQNGQTRYYQTNLSSILNRQAALVGYVIMMNDITEQRQQQETIRHLAFHDALTGLPNRVLLSERLNQALVSCHRSGTRGSLMILDLDRFKDINDTLGHSMGDLLLKGVAERLNTLLRKSDTVSRMGGDEFVILFPLVNHPDGVSVVAGKIVEAFREPFVCDGHVLSVTASLGIADFPDDGDDNDTLLKKADIALYRVKEAGRNGFQRYAEQVTVD